MPDRDPSRPDFERAANRAAHEREQLAKTLSEDAQRALADAKEKSRIERETKQREQQRRYREDIEKRKALIRDRERIAYRPRWATDRMSEKRIRERAEKEVRANNKSALEAIDKKLEKNLDRILAEHAPEKKREQAKDRRYMEELAAQKRADRNATRPDAGHGDASSPADPAKDAKTREKEFIDRVAARLRKGKQHDAHERGGHGRD